MNKKQDITSSVEEMTPSEKAAINETGVSVHNSLMYCFLVVCLFLSGANKAYGQCDFAVDVKVVEISECPSSGVIQATLTGANVNNGNIHTGDAKYSITSVVAGGYTAPYSANNGRIIEVPPGEYVITAQAFCAKTNSWHTATSSSITMTGTYPGLNINKIRVVTADIEKSLKCSPTGMIPIEVGSGKAPYSVEILSATDASLVGQIYTRSTEGTVNISGLPAGSYVFAVNDGCRHGTSVSAQIEEIQPSFTVTKVKNTPVCEARGEVELTLKDGTKPYTIKLEVISGSYSGQTDFTRNEDGAFTIGNLNAGEYSFAISDKCFPDTLKVKIQEENLNSQISGTTSTSSCDASGSLTFNLAGGLPPYEITVTQHPSAYTGSTQINVSTEGNYILNNLPSGYYEFTITDKCKNIYVPADANISIDSIKAELLNVDNAHSCDNSGSARIRLSSGKTPFTLNMFANPASYLGTPPSNIPNKGNISLSGLTAGNYGIEFIDACGNKDTVRFTVAKDKLQAAAADVLKSFDCISTGEFSIIILNGIPMYKVEMLSYPAGYTGNTADSSMLPHITFDSLAAGWYKLRVTDACPDTVVIEVQIDTLFFQDIQDLYRDHFYPPDPSDANCKTVRIVKKTDFNDPDMEYYWVNNADKYFEVAFVEDNDLSGVRHWQSVTSYKDTLFVNDTYCSGRANKRSFTAHIRAKGGSCGEILDVIRFDSVQAKINGPYDENCDGFSFDFEQYTDSRGLICYPYTWTLVDEQGNTVLQSQNAVADASKQTVTDVEHGHYRLHFKDAEGCEWISDSIISDWKNTQTPSIGYSNHTCTSYSVTFSDPNICLPYSWELKDPSDALVAGVATVNDRDPQTVNNLLYDIDYSLHVWNSSSDETYIIRQDKTLFDNYDIDFTPSYCLPDTAKGSIRLFRNGTPDAYEKGTIIRFVSGATTPIHTVDTIRVDGVKEYFPFSPDSTVQTWQNIEPDTYIFEIKDACGVVKPLSVDYKKSSIRGFAYDSIETCNGMEVYPRGTIYLGNTALTTYFRVCKTPPGIAPVTGSVTQGGFLFLPETGTYLIQASVYNGDDSCPYDTLSIFYIKKTLALDADSTRAYVCDPNQPGYINIKRKGGIGPFTYELFDNGVSQGINSTGVFHYGRVGETYDVRIFDEGCNAWLYQYVVMLNLAGEKLVDAGERLCAYGTIELNCLSLGSYTVYNWTGPDNFVSNLQNPRIDSATVAMSGTYTLQVTPEGCMSPIIQTVDVEVIDPPPPTVTSPVLLCVNAPQSALDVSPTSEDYRLQWYAADSITRLPSAPVPPTNRADTFTYYVSQISLDLGCEGLPAKIEVIIIELPDTVAFANAPDICPGLYPTFIIPETYDGYTYNLYSESGTLAATGVSEGGELQLTGNEKLYNSQRFYVEVLNIHKCASENRSTVTVNVVNNVYIEPDKIPRYEREIPYSVQLFTNGVSPYEFSLVTPLPDGFDMTSQGLITGSAPRNGRIDPVPFTVMVTDADGCTAEREYLLESNIFIPQVFTPNGDGKNDVFMKGRRLVIFDRLGIKIFEGDDGWDGTYKDGQAAPADTYFYLLFYEDEKLNTEGRKKGYITLIRRR